MSDNLSRIHPVLVRPMFPGNIGSAARAACAMGLGNVRLVEPAAAINGEAREMAAGAREALAAVERYDDLRSAISDCRLVIGLSARRRAHRMRAILLSEAAPIIMERAEGEGRTALLFGNERTGLENEELDRSNIVVRIETSKEFGSLNLAMAVMVVGYALRTAAGGRRPKRRLKTASAEDLERLFEHIEEALSRRGFFVPKKEKIAMRRIRDLIGRAAPYDSEVKLLRGVIKALDTRPDIS